MKAYKHMDVQICQIVQLTHADRAGIVVWLRNDRDQLASDRVGERFGDVVVVKGLILKMLRETRAGTKK